ncbi:hypothetical protein [Enterococcus sp. AZ196]|uniref:hypothetical protein n=1 Tax=Enterococcus sp. AZ196 TaxID=2774659 RepID=UPI003D2D7569
MQQLLYYPHTSPNPAKDYQEEAIAKKNTYFIMQIATMYVTKQEHSPVIDKLYEALLHNLIDTVSYREPNNLIEVIRYSPRIPERYTDFSVLKMAHELSVYFDLSPVFALSIVWSNWARAVYQKRLKRFVAFAVNSMKIAPCECAEETALKGIHAMENFFRAAHLPLTFEEVGIFPTDSEISKLAENCLPQGEEAAKTIQLILKCSQ